MSAQVLLGMSLRQPWLDMILSGAKSVEIRGWTMPTGEMVALHAARNVDLAAAYFYGYQHPHNLPRGAVLAVAMVASIERLDRKRWASAVYRHRQPLPPTDSAYAIALSHIRALSHPIPCRGQTRYFRLPTNVTAQLEEQLRSQA